MTGVLTGVELRPLLVSKGVPMLGLAKIWALCDISNTGKLNQEQYALALHLIDLHKVSVLV
jgi:epidermal growth factor receptor substrate 15